MRFVWLAVILLACNSDESRESRALEAKERAVAAARKAASDAEHAMQEAQAKAKDAWERLEAARAAHAKASEETAEVKGKLAEVRKQAAETIKLADVKLVELRATVQTLADKIKAGGSDTAKLVREKAELEAMIAKIETMKAELAASSK
jgi:chromosome segregation ATPase